METNTYNLIVVGISGATGRMSSQDEWIEGFDAALAAFCDAVSRPHIVRAYLSGPRRYVAQGESTYGPTIATFERPEVDVDSVEFI